MSAQPISFAVITARTPCPAPPRWAVLQRDLFRTLDASVALYIAKYTRDDGTLIYRDDWPDDRDGLDDLYEAFHNFPLLYLLGGDDSLLPLSHRQWEAVTKQGEAFGLVHKEYEVGYDQFHQSEGNLFFCFLCAADPETPASKERARRFAGFYLGEEPESDNYDKDLNIIKAVHNGSRGGRGGYLETPEFWSVKMGRYGLPFDDLPGITSYDDIANSNRSEEAKANRQVIFDIMNERMGWGDSVANLPVTSLVSNAFLMTGDVKYRDWVTTYVLGWWNRAEANGGFIPDNVGLDGAVGSNHGGRWYGAAYGWSWPHGYDSVIGAVTVAATNAVLLTGSTDWLDLPGRHFDVLYDMGRKVEDIRDLPMSDRDAWVEAASAATDRFDAYVMPKRVMDGGWFDEQTVGLSITLACWSLSFGEAEIARIHRLENDEPFDWAQSYVFHTKGDDGHERPWLTYLGGLFPDYPEVILDHGLQSVAQRLQAIAEDDADLTRVNIHHWQEHNPVTTEALIQLTLGAPQALYNGGVINSCFRHFDADAGRPGLPRDVAALVSNISATSATITFVNTSATEDRRLLTQGGFYNEHKIISATTETGQTIDAGGNLLWVALPAATQVTLTVALARLARNPSYKMPALEQEGRSRMR